MARFWLLLVISFSAGAVTLAGLAPQQGHPEAYPTGVFCSPKGDVVKGKPNGAHICKCQRHDDGNPENPYTKEMCKAGEPVNPSHDPVCKQECHEEHCLCPVACDVKGHHQ